MSLSVRYVKCIILLIFLCARRLLFIPEGVSVMTVIIDGVDVAPAGLVKRSPGSRELGVGPLDITTQAP